MRPKKATKSVWEFHSTYKRWHHWSIHHGSAWTHSWPRTHSRSHHLSHDGSLWLWVERRRSSFLILRWRCCRGAGGGRWRVCDAIFVPGWCGRDVATTSFAPASNVWNKQKTFSICTFHNKICRYSLLLGRNVSWPRRMLPTEYADRTDRRMPDCYITLSARVGQCNKTKLTMAYGSLVLLGNCWSDIFTSEMWFLNNN